MFFFKEKLFWQKNKLKENKREGDETELSLY